MKPTANGMTRELLRRVRAHNYRTRTERLASVRAGIGVLDGYTLDDLRIVLPGRKVEWLTSFDTLRNAVVHPNPNLITLDDAGHVMIFNGNDGRMFTVALDCFFTVSSSPVYHKIRAPRKVR